jgi:hypothetical protein
MITAIRAWFAEWFDPAPVAWVETCCVRNHGGGF